MISTASFSAARFVHPTKHFAQNIFSSWQVCIIIAQETVINNGLKFCIKRDFSPDR